MSQLQKKLILISFAFTFAAHASLYDTIGITLLRATTTNLNGSGVRVGQPEAGDGAMANWQVNPASVSVATNIFTYIYGSGLYLTVSSTNVFPNSLGSESGHAGIVAGFFYGITNVNGFPFGVTNGVATNVFHVNNYEANTFLNYYIAGGHTFPERVVNQSFTIGSYSASDDKLFDDYADANKTLFISGAAGQPIFSPASCYNGIGVGSLAFTNGPTPDGRSKPDLVAPGPFETSYTAAQVSGAVAILMQAGARGDGGSDTNSATDIRTIKALLLNGAVKPTNWTHSTTAPLDSHFGAGVLNVFNSYQQLIGGKRTNFFPTAISGSNPHPPVSVTNTIPVLNGWDFQSIASSMSAYNVNHYFFNVTNGGSSSFIVSAMLVWNKQAGETGINNLDLFLYNCANSNLVACSTSLVDNVEHIFLPRLAQGRYDLQVLMRSGGVNPGNNSETYALAFEFAPTTLSVLKSGTNVNLSWPIYPAGFMAEATTNLVSQDWRTNGIATATVTNSQNVISIPATNANRFFRLRMPNF